MYHQQKVPSAHNDVVLDSCNAEKMNEEQLRQLLANHPEMAGEIAKLKGD